VAIDLDQQVVVVDFSALERISGGAFDGISVGRSSPGHKICNATVLMTLVIVNMPRKNHHAEMCVRLPCFEHLRQFVFLPSRGVSAAILLFIGGGGVGRMMEVDENEIDVSGYVV
jgi:hypothetical protein